MRPMCDCSLIVQLHIYLFFSAFILITWKIISRRESAVNNSKRNDRKWMRNENAFFAYQNKQSSVDSISMLAAIYDFMVSTCATNEIKCRNFVLIIYRSTVAVIVSKGSDTKWLISLSMLSSFLAIIKSKWRDSWRRKTQNFLRQNHIRMFDRNAIFFLFPFELISLEMRLRFTTLPLSNALCSTQKRLMDRIVC